MKYEDGDVYEGEYKDHKRNGKEFINIRRVIYMKENLKMVILMGMEHINLKMVIYMKENLKIVNLMG